MKIRFQIGKKWHILLYNEPHARFQAEELDLLELKEKRGLQRIQNILLRDYKYLSPNEFKLHQGLFGKIQNYHVTELDVFGMSNHFPNLANFPQLKRFRLDNEIVANHIPYELPKENRLESFTFHDENACFLPLSFKNFRNLRLLDLSFNCFRQYFGNLFRFSNLEYLLLCQNFLTQIPDEIGELKQLKCLDLQFNPIIEMSPRIGELTQLVMLLLTDNRLKQLPESVCHLAALKILDISGVAFGKFPPKSFLFHHYKF